MHSLRRLWLPLVMLSLPIGLGFVFFGLPASGSEVERPQGSVVTPQDAPQARHGHSLVSIGGYAYLFGGSDSSGPLSSASSPLTAALNDLWKYDFADNVWSPISAPNPPPARAYHSAAVFSGKMYIFGGHDGAATSFNDAWSYDPTATAWTRVPTPTVGFLPEARYGHRAVSTDSAIYVVGGRDGNGLRDGCVWNYLPDSNRWSGGGCLPSGRYDFSAANLGGQIVIWGGRTSASTYLSDAWTYDPQISDWGQLVTVSGGQPITLPATALGATASSGDTMWIFGGQGADGPALDTAWQLQYPGFPMLTTNRMSQMPAGRSGAAAAVGPQSGFGPQVGTPRVLIFGGQRGGQPVAESNIYLVGSSRLYLPVLMRNHE